MQQLTHTFSHKHSLCKRPLAAPPPPPPEQLLINNEFVDSATGKTFKTYDPRTGEVGRRGSCKVALLLVRGRVQTGKLLVARLQAIDKYRTTWAPRFEAFKLLARRSSPAGRTP